MLKQLGLTNKQKKEEINKIEKFLLLNGFKECQYFESKAKNYSRRFHKFIVVNVKLNRDTVIMKIKVLQKTLFLNDFEMFLTYSRFLSILRMYTSPIIINIYIQ